VAFVAVACRSRSLQIQGFVSTAPKIPPDEQQTEAADYKSIALPFRLNFSDDLTRAS